MGSHATTNTRRRKMRQKLRQLAPWLDQRTLVTLSNIEHPVERVGALVVLTHQRAGTVADIAAIEEHRRQVAATFDGVAVPHRLGELNEQIQLARIRNAPGALTELERSRMHLLIGAHGRAEAARLLYADAPDQPDDRRYRPTHVDSVLRGPARATGQTAAAVRRRTTVTDWQHRERTAP